MTSGRQKSQADVFLGTADIIARVQMAQSRPATRAFATLRRYVTLLCAALVAVSMVLLSYRSFVAHRRQEHKPPLASSAAPQKQQDAQVEQTPDQVPSAQRPAPRGTSRWVYINVQQQPATLWLDGTKIADKKHAWSGKLMPGNHQLAVRVGGRMMRHGFVVGANALTIVVHPTQQRFEVTSAGKSRRASRSRGD